VTPVLPHVAFDHVTVRFDRTIALDDVSLDIPPHQIFGIIGPANAGKTTLLKCINRTIDFAPDVAVTGHVTVAGDDVFAVKDVCGLRRRVAMVSPLPVGLPLSVYDNVAAGLRFVGAGRGELDDRVREALVGASLWDEVKDRLGKPGAGLSGGQQQRLCIARALAVDPEVLLMDEPCSALDPVATLRIEELIAELKQRVTIAIVTHNMQQAARVADTTAFMLGGELVEVAATEKIFTNPSDERTEQYVSGKFG